MQVLCQTIWSYKILQKFYIWPRGGPHTSMLRNNNKVIYRVAV
jgi:hypothetical protein